MFKLTIEGTSPSDLKTKLLAAASEIGGAAAPATDKPNKPAAAKAPATPKAPALTFKADVAPLLLQLADKNRDKAKEVLASFGVAKGAELTAEQLPEAKAAFEAAIAEVDEDLAG